MRDDVLHELIVITEGGHICRPLIDNDLYTHTSARTDRAQSGREWRKDLLSIRNIVKLNTLHFAAFSHTVTWCKRWKCVNGCGCLRFQYCCMNTAANLHSSKLLYKHTNYTNNGVELCVYKGAFALLLHILYCIYTYISQITNRDKVNFQFE